jgi:hypothetical protein
MTSNSEIRQKILDLIERGGDLNSGAILILILGVLDEISSKIDDMRADKTGLREVVLNGHSKVHEAHHRWIEAQISEQAENRKGWKSVAFSLVEKFIYLAVGVLVALWIPHVGVIVR